MVLDKLKHLIPEEGFKRGHISIIVPPLYPSNVRTIALRLPKRKAIHLTLEK